MNTCGSPPGAVTLSVMILPFFVFAKVQVMIWPLLVGVHGQLSVPSLPVAGRGCSSAKSP